MTDNKWTAPRMGDGLLLRWGTPEDAEELGEFNAAHSSRQPGEPGTFLAHWTHDLMNGRPSHHPRR